ncbi:MAG: hypothetical protein ACO26G_04805 [Rickettsiales bacterium]
MLQPPSNSTLNATSLANSIARQNNILQNRRSMIIELNVPFYDSNPIDSVRARSINPPSRAIDSGLNPETSWSSELQIENALLDLRRLSHENLFSNSHQNNRG